VRDGFTEVGKVRELLQLGLGRLVDREGIDWWELTAIFVHQQLESLVVLWKFANDVPRDGEVWITRGGFDADALRLVLGSRLNVMSSQTASSRRGPRHYLRRLWRLPNSQVIQVLGDKYDIGYRIRRHFHRRQRGGDQPVVLVPSSYINMSLTGTAYAGLLPETGFLLVSTRLSGRLRETPGNVRQAWLASYAGESGDDEYREILGRWEGLKREIDAVPELAALAPFDLALRDGQVVALAGLLGSGRTETARMVFGVERADTGTVQVAGEKVRVGSPRDAVGLGFGYCPEERKTEGIIAELSVRENIVLALQARRGWMKPLSRREQDEIARHFITLLDIRPADPERPIGLLSGGNQQKALLARWLATKPRLLILDEPTRGIDVGAKAEVHAIIDRLASDGMAVLLVSSELPEILGMSDRILVMRDGELAGEFRRGEVTEEGIMTVAAGVAAAGRPDV